MKNYLGIKIANHDIENPIGRWLYYMVECAYANGLKDIAKEVDKCLSSWQYNSTAEDYYKMLIKLFKRMIRHPTMDLYWRTHDFKVIKYVPTDNETNKGMMLRFNIEKINDPERDLVSYINVNIPEHLAELIIGRKTEFIKSTPPKNEEIDE